ncbi:glycosyltransferase [Pedobacter antarcticus]|uniref:glycosyltransferase n=1 Tax=Pedobacter antarcticus TaxID=34086 RepID=UPI00292F9D33|nr:glycosyltransferase [Pedobacter antarcticus]
MKSKKILIIGLVWPEPDSSAAGTRIIQLIKLLLSENHQLIFASAAGKGPHSFDLTSLEVTEKAIILNNSSFDTFLQEINPDVVIYDRFVTEEQYGWRIAEHCPNAITILDTEDLHGLRKARQKAHKHKEEFNPEAVFSDSVTIREISAILRCDLSLIISETEMQLLLQDFRIDPSLLCYLPFLEEIVRPADILQWKKYQDREGFMFIGNFLHEPNWNTVQILKTRIWPVLSKILPGVGMHIYGAYCSQKVTQLHNEKERFYVHGRADDSLGAISKHRILLAPILFGAGLKGKLIHAMQTGTPSVTTTIGAEGMYGDLPWNGFITDDFEDFSQFAAQLYTNQELWTQCRNNGVAIINERFEKTKSSKTFISMLQNISANPEQHRRHNFTGTILRFQTMNSTKYMSLWIEQKNAADQSR